MITLTLNDQEIQNVLEGLSNMPLHKSFDTFISVRNQVMQQRQQQAAPQGMQAGQQAGGQPNGADVSKQS